MDFPIKMVIFHSYVSLPEGKPNRSPSYIHQLRVHELQHDLALSVFFFSSGVTPPQNWYNNPDNPAFFF